MTKAVVPGRRNFAMKMPFLPLLMLASGCSTAVYNPDKGNTETQADIDACKQEADRRHYWNRVAALKFAKQCLETKGYRRGPAAPDRAGAPDNGGARRKPAAGQPCEIPCG